MRPPRRHNRADPQRGGLLLETVIALALTAMLAAAAAAAMRFGAATLERAADQGAAAAQGLRDDRALRAALAGMGPDAALRGDAGAMVWRGAGRDAADAPRWGLWRLSAAGGALRLAACDGDDPADPGPCAPVATLGPAAAPLFAYASGGAWVERWRAAAPPALIRVRRPAGARVVAPPGLAGAPP